MSEQPNLPSEALEYTQADLELCVKTVWGEARGEGEAGWTAVAWVLRNRAASPGWWGRTLSEVCLAKQQFSCWNPQDPNSAKIAGLDLEDPLVVQITTTLRAVLDGRVPDPTLGADHYQVIGTGATWAHSPSMTVVIGRQAFYKLGLGG